MADTCATCRFWDAYTKDSAFYDEIRPGAIGDCRRRAPRISDELLRRTMPGPGCDQFEGLANNIYVPSAFPVTAGESWCGEYELNATQIEEAANGASSSEENRHADWLDQRMAAWEHANAARSDDECNERMEAVYKIEDQILDTPAVSRVEGLSKLQLLAIHHKESALLDTQRVHAVIAEIFPLLTRGEVA